MADAAQKIRGVLSDGERKDMGIGKIEAELASQTRHSG